MLRWIYIQICKKQLANIKKSYEACWQIYGEDDYRTIHWKERWQMVSQDIIKTLTSNSFT